MLVDNNFKNYINNFIRTNILTNLNINEFEQIINLFCNLIDFLSIRFNFDFSKSSIYINQFKQNNNRDLIALFNLLFPYIDDKGGNYDLHKEIYSIKDISIKKIKTPKEDNTKNNFLISNIQYSRGIINPYYIYKKYNLERDKFYHDLNSRTTTKLYKNDLDKIPLAKYQKNMFTANHDQSYLYYELNMIDITTNYYLLLKTINTISNKLFINWISIKPITWNYKQTILYKNTYKYKECVKKVYYPNLKTFIDINTPFVVIIENHEITMKPWYCTHIDLNNFSINAKRFQYKYNIEKEVDKLEIKNKYQGIAVDDFYNMIHHELYFGIRDYKWLLYEIKDENDNIINLINYVKIMLPISETIILNKLKWIDLSTDEKQEWLLAKEKISMIVSDSRFIDNKNILGKNLSLLIFNILLFFERKYSKILSVGESYFKLKINENFFDIKSAWFQEAGITGEELLDFIDQETVGYSDVNKIDILNSWESLDVEYLYDFLYETIEGFSKTWYGYRIIEKNEKNPIFNNEEIKFKIYKYNHILSFKNIYNWAKSLLINMIEYSDNIAEALDNLVSTNNKKINVMFKLRLIQDYTWNSYHYFNQEYFTTILLCTYHYEYFNINRVLKLLYDDINIENTRFITENIDKNIKKNLTDIIFECLILRGLLNEFFVDSHLTDKNIYKTRKTQQKLVNKLIIKPNINEYNECYYFLTNKTYGELPLIHPINKPNLVQTYFERLLTEEWYLFYAMDWISQISFYHRYINKNVIFITGGTGVGKTSQIPKLLLYALKMIDCKISASVVCTVPRTKIADTTATKMGDDMGVPVKVYSNNFKNSIKSFNKYIQYKTKSDSHEFQDSSFYIRFVTDGTLLAELYNNPILKKKYIDIKKIDEYNQDGILLLHNKYDIIFLDESHEHNKNMDMILTLLKYTIYWNTSIRLIISSATMDDDEPIYRRYYKGINDNNLFPLCLSNHNIVFKYNDDVMTLDRITIDNRVHISPPGEVTQHKIKEYYLEKDTTDYEQCEKEALSILKELFAQNVKGDILLFSITKDKINKLVEYINDNSPPYVICLPYYSGLPDKYSNISDLISNLHLFNIYKKDVMKEINKANSGRKVSFGTYTQAVIIATNAAEASLTLFTLNYVIETGYYLNVKYNPETDLAEVSYDKISESSRLQRKGRVGRVRDGYVYYTYAKDSRKNIKPKYKICVEDFKYNIIDLYRKRINEPYYINHNFFDINSIYKLVIFKMLNSGYNNDFIIEILEDENLIKKDILNKFWNLTDIRLRLSKKERKQIINIYNILLYNRTLFGQMFYYCNNKYLSYHSIPNAFILNYNINYYNPLPRLETGYPLHTIFDFFGNFYIVHPCEDLINRDILTGIINIDYSIEFRDQQFIKKMLNYYSNLVGYNVLIPSDQFDLPAEIIPYKYENLKFNFSEIYVPIINITVIKNYIKSYDDLLEKTEFFNQVLYIKNAFDFEKYSDNSNLVTGCVIAFIYSYLYNCMNEVLFIIATLFMTNADLKKWLKTYKDANDIIRYRYDKLPWKTFGNNYGDLITFYYIFKKINEDLPNLNILNINKFIEKKITKKDFELLISKYVKNKNDISDLIKKKDKNSWNNFDLEMNTFNTLQKLENKNKLNANGYNDFNQESIENIKFNAEENDILKFWSNNYDLNYDTLTKTINIYNILKKKIDDNIEKLIWFKLNIKVFIDEIKENNIIKCFVHGFNNNILIHNYRNKQFYKLKSQNISVLKYKYLLKSLYKKSILDYSLNIFDKYMLYIALNQFNQALIINNIKFEWLFECAIHLYNPYILSYKNRALIEEYDYIISDLINKYDKKYLDNLINYKIDQKYVDSYKILENENNIRLYYINLRNKINEKLNL